jgi:hypothetical protein
MFIYIYIKKKNKKKRGGNIGSCPQVPVHETRTTVREWACW